MAQLEVIVNKLNRRKSPIADFSDKSNVVNVLPKGHVFEAVGEITNVLGKWYVDKDGYFVWGKGVTKEIFQYQKFKAEERFNDSIRKLWVQNGFGKGVGVALIDESDISVSEPFFNQSQIKRNDTKSSNHIHGTKMAGIICGREVQNTIFGVATASNIYNYNGTDFLDLINALNEVAGNNNVKIINLSLQPSPDILPSQIKTRIKGALIRAIENNKIIVSATGNKDYLSFLSSDFNDDKKVSSQIIVVSSYDRGQFLRRDQNASFDDKMVYYVENFISNYVKPNGNQSAWSSVDFNSSSEGTALVSAILAILFASGKIETMPSARDFLDSKIRLESIIDDSGKQYQRKLIRIENLLI